MGRDKLILHLDGGAQGIRTQILALTGGTELTVEDGQRGATIVFTRRK